MVSWHVAVGIFFLGIFCGVVLISIFGAPSEDKDDD